MPFLKQNMNQFAQTPILGAVDLIPQPDVVTAQIDPASAAVYIQQGSVVRLKTGTSGAILVDVQTGPTDTFLGFGVIPYNEQKNLYSPGSIVEVVRQGVVWMLTSAAVVRGTKVAVTAATVSTDPTIATDVTVGHQVIGTAIDEATAAGQLIRVSVLPSTN